MIRAFVLTLSCLLILSACRRESSATAPQPANPVASATPPVAAAPASPAPSAIAPLAAHGEASRPSAGASGGATVTTPTLAFDLPAGWAQQTAASAMRAAQVSVPGAAGPGELVLFYFGPGQGGGVESNFDRWQGQMQVDGQASPERGELQANGFKISWIEVKGTLLPSTMGSGPSSPQPGSRLLGAVVEGDGGPWFFKLTGPDATLAAQREAFFALLRGVRRP